MFDAATTRISRPLAKDRAASVSGLGFCGIGLYDPAGPFLNLRAARFAVEIRTGGNQGGCRGILKGRQRCASLFRQLLCLVSLFGQFPLWLSIPLSVNNTAPKA